MKRIAVIAVLASPISALAQTTGTHTSPFPLATLAQQVARQIPATALSGLDVSNARLGSETVSSSIAALRDEIGAVAQRGSGGARSNGRVSTASLAGDGSLLTEKLNASNAAFRAVRDKFTDYVTPQDFGAACNGTTDDSAAFQSAVTYVAEHGKGLSISGTCVVKSTIVMPTDALGMDISGSGGGTIKTSVAGDLFTLATPSTGKSNARIQVSIHDLSVTQTNPGTGTAFDFYQPVPGAGSIQAFMKNVYITNMQIGVSLHNVGGSYLDTITSADTDGPDSGSWNVYIKGDGPSQSGGQPSANNNITNSGSIRGNGIMLYGFVQGTFIDNHRCLLCHYGIRTSHEDAGEALTILNTYEEANLAGFDIENTAFTTMRGVSVDLLGNASPHWAGFRLVNDAGSAIMDSIALGVGGAGSIADTSIFDIENSPGYYVNNYVRGLVFRSDGTVFPCWKVVGTKARNDPTILSNNICWASGNYQVTNPGTIQAHDNLWSGPKNDTTLIYENDVTAPNIFSSGLKGGNGVVIGTQPKGNTAALGAYADSTYANNFIEVMKGNMTMFSLDPNGAPTFKGAVKAPLFEEKLTTPSSSHAACAAGQFTDDARYHYVCVATNIWKRVALSDF